MGEKPIRRTGVLTGGGDCPGLNALIRAVVKRAILEYGWYVIGDWPAEQIVSASEREVRTTAPGHVQRGGSPSAFDRKPATWSGSEAVGLVARQAWGEMVALHGERIEAVRIADAVRTLKTVPLDRHRVRAARAPGLSLGE